MLGCRNSLLGAIDGIPEVATTNRIGGFIGAVTISKILAEIIVGKTVRGVGLG